MPRTARLDAPGVLHHVMARGIENKKIFINDQDREDFLARLLQIVQAGSLDIFAWVLMPNHFHLMVESVSGNLGDAMKYVTSQTNRATDCCRHTRHEREIAYAL